MDADQLKGGGGKKRGRWCVPPSSYAAVGNGLLLFVLINLEISTLRLESHSDFGGGGPGGRGFVVWSFFSRGRRREFIEIWCGKGGGGGKLLY